MTLPAITIQQLSKSFGTHRVLDEVSFAVQPGETFALLGINGAGKTTTIQILLGLLALDAGEVRVAGYDPQADPIPLRRNVGYLAEDQTMYGWMTPTELCRFLRPFYPTWDTTLADKLLDGFEVPRSARIENLSKGQTVRLGLALALAHRPPVAILDDPALGLDPIARKQFSRDLVEHLQSGGSTVLYSSHLLHEVEAVADTIAILHGGRIVRQESTDELRRQVRQITLEAIALAGLERPASLLDLRIDGSRAILTLAEAPVLLEQLRTGGIAHEASELSLDEIFEAYVIGRPTGWPQANRTEKVSV
jgi:ABC-2 type transport system ATP-binding protein